MGSAGDIQHSLRFWKTYPENGIRFLRGFTITHKIFPKSSTKGGAEGRGPWAPPPNQRSESNKQIMNRAREKLRT